MNTKQIFVEVMKSANPAYDASFVMSASAPDRVKDTIDPTAYKASEGKKLIALWQHNHEQPIGYWENIKSVSGKLVGDIKFASTQLAQMVKTLIHDGVPLGASIGFRGRGEVKKDGGMHFKTIELMECSVVSVPCHPQAMQIAKSYGFNLENLLGTERGLTLSQKVALSRAKGLLAPETEEPAEAPLAAFDRVAAEARAYLVANAATIDPDCEIEVTLGSGDYEVCFSRG